MQHQYHLLAAGSCRPRAGQRRVAADHEQISAGALRFEDCLCIDAAVHLEKTVSCAEHLPDLRDFRVHVMHVALSAEARLNGHDQNILHLIEERQDSPCRRVRLQGNARLDAVFVNCLNGIKRVGETFQMEGNHIRPGFRKMPHILQRVVDHQVNVHEQLRLLVGCLQNRHTKRNIRHKQAVHHIIMQHLHACLLHAADLLTEPHQVGIEDRR